VIPYRHRQRFGYARRLDQQVVKPPLARQSRHFAQQVLAQRAADAAVGHFDQLFFHAVEFVAAPDELRVDVHLAHVVHDDGDAAPFAVVQHVVQQGRLARAQKAGQLGIALLLFLVGLELSLDKIRDVGKVAVVAGLGQVVFTAAGGIALSMLLGFTVMESIFLGTALTFSSTVVVVKLLTQKEELDALYGRIAVGIFLVQDLVVIVVLTLLTGLGQPDEMTPGAIATGVGSSFGGMFVLLLAALLSALMSCRRSSTGCRQRGGAVRIWSLCWCFLFVVAAELFHVSAEIGAFLAGLSLAQLPTTTTSGGGCTR
jgi:predicted Kef-type K+ transport protein